MSDCAVEVLIETLRGIRQQVQPEVLRQAAESTLRLQRVVGPCEVAVLVTSDEKSRELNQRHRGVDAPTDVLAFPSGATGPFVEAPGLPRYLGDVIISFPTAVAQAAEAGVDLSAELQLLVVHGVLHLLGYDDHAAAERAEMWRAQQRVLDDLGVEARLPD